MLIKTAHFALILLVVLVCSLYGSPHVTFGQATGGTILGTIHDASGGAIAGAKVSVKSQETGVVQTTMSDGSGVFQVASLTAGVYEVQAAMSGFKRQIKKDIVLTVGAGVTVNFALEVGQVQEEVVVHDEPAQIETTTATVSGVVGETAIRELPLNGRDWLQLATLQAGVIGGLGQQSAAISTNSRAARGNGENLYISGNRPTENLYLLDGLIVNDYANGSPGSGLNVNLGVDAVREFAVLTSDYGAQYGITSGGVVNAIFKSGTNQIHGDVFGFFRNSALDTRNVFDNGDPTKGPAGTPPFHRNQYGGSLGGPIVKDKTFFFGSFEGLNQDRSISEDTLTLSNAARSGMVGNQPVAIAQSIVPYLALFPVANGPDVLVKGVPDGTAHYVFSGAETGSEYYAVGKLDHNFSEQTRLSASFQWDTGALLQPDGYNQKLVGSPSDHYNFTTSLQHSFTPTAINTARIGVSRTFAADSQDVSALSALDTNTQLGFIPNLPVGIFTAGNLATAGGIGASGADSFNFTSYQASDDVNWIRGRHTLQFGFLFDRIDDNFNSANFPRGEWDYNTVQDLLTNT